MLSFEEKQNPFLSSEEKCHFKAAHRHCSQTINDCHYSKERVWVSLWLVPSPVGTNRVTRKYWSHSRLPKDSSWQSHHDHREVLRTQHSTQCGGLGGKQMKANLRRHLDCITACYKSVVVSQKVVLAYRYLTRVLFASFVHSKIWVQKRSACFLFVLFELCNFAWSRLPQRTSKFPLKVVGVPGYVRPTYMEWDCLITEMGFFGRDSLVSPTHNGPDEFFLYQYSSSHRIGSTFLEIDQMFYASGYDEWNM